MKNGFDMFKRCSMCFLEKNFLMTLKPPGPGGFNFFRFFKIGSCSKNPTKYPVFCLIMLHLLVNRKNHHSEVYHVTKKIIRWVFLLSLYHSKKRPFSFYESVIGAAATGVSVVSRTMRQPQIIQGRVHKRDSSWISRTSQQTFHGPFAVDRVKRCPGCPSDTVRVYYFWTSKVNKPFYFIISNVCKKENSRKKENCPKGNIPIFTGRVIDPTK